jgi:ATP-dependent protease ClpP protease subunit
MAAEGPVVGTIGNPTDNHLYFYENIDSGSALRLMRELRSLDTHFIKERIERGVEWGTPYHPIWLHIQSDGGEVFASLAIADLIKSMRVPVYSVIEGSACSGATILSAACKRRYIHKNSFMMIHQVSGGNWGTYAEHKDEMKILSMIMKSLTSFYKKNSLLSKKQVEEMLKHDSWMDAKKAYKKGFVDFIIGEEDDDIDYESELYERRKVKANKK